MSNLYTTGELAKACNITVRTVQYYDTQNLLNPSELTEGGRRLYSEEDKQKMELICTLRELGLSLEIIRRIFKEENSRQVVETLLQERKDELTAELEERKQQVLRINNILHGIQSTENYSLEMIDDIVKNMEDRKKLKKMYTKLVLLFGIPITIYEWGSFIFWICTGNWIPFAVYIFGVLPATCFIAKYVHGQTAYICPDCHKVFRPDFKEYMFSKHTPKTRRLTCVACGHKSYCIETSRKPEMSFDEKKI